MEAESKCCMIDNQPNELICKFQLTKMMDTLNDFPTFSIA